MSDKKKVYVETIEKVYDPMLEEMWGIKREIAAEHPSLDEYFNWVAD